MDEEELTHAEELLHQLLQQHPRESFLSFSLMDSRQLLCVFVSIIVCFVLLLPFFLALAPPPFPFSPFVVVRAAGDNVSLLPQHCLILLTLGSSEAAFRFFDQGMQQPSSTASLNAIREAWSPLDNSDCRLQVVQGLNPATAPVS